MYLQQFTFEVKYRAGKNHGNTDALSRRLSTEQVLTVTQHLQNDLSNLQAAQQTDSLLGPMVAALSNGSPLPTTKAPRLKYVFLKDGLLCHSFKQTSSSMGTTQIILPNSLHKTVLEQLHNQSGHMGIHKTMENIKQRYYWPGYVSDVEKWIRECPQCQQRDHQQPNQHTPLGTIEAKYPFEKVFWDIMGPLPTTSQGNKYILVVTDLFSKWTEAFPLKSTDSQTLATVLVNEVICRFGVPATLHSDQGANLTSNLISALCKLLGITQTRTTAYPP